VFAYSGYSSASASCSQEVRTCNQGNLSGSMRNGFCTEENVTSNTGFVREPCIEIENGVRTNSATVTLGTRRCIKIKISSAIAGLNSDLLKSFSDSTNINIGGASMSLNPTLCNGTLSSPISGLILYTQPTASQQGSVIINFDDQPYGDSNGYGKNLPDGKYILNFISGVPNNTGSLTFYAMRFDFDEDRDTDGADISSVVTGYSGNVEKRKALDFFNSGLFNQAAYDLMRYKYSGNILSSASLCTNPGIP
jgi:hypothetical protein